MGLLPPFNSAQTYNAFFQEKDGTAAASQNGAFEDTWHWNQESEAVCNTFTFSGHNEMLAPRSRPIPPRSMTVATISFMPLRNHAG